MGTCPPRITVAAQRGGTGKTTFTIGLLQSLRDMGIKVAPFKKGPDYIDPFWHGEAAGHICRNLDPYLMGPDKSLASFQHYARGFDAAVIEGNRGLFDGKDAKGSYSTAELARLLKSPVILVVDCSMASRTIAAQVLGCKVFESDLDLVGVVLNPVANSRQEKVIRQAIQDSTGLPVLGAVPRLDMQMPERHMGLVPPQEHDQVSDALEKVGRSIAGYVDVDAIWQLMQKAPDCTQATQPLSMPAAKNAGRRVRIGVIRDAAFGFYYPENLELLEASGAELVFCSALEDSGLPDLNALYIGGGFPETHAKRLSRNKGFLASVRHAADSELPIYAECGGLMYLGRSIANHGTSHEMAGIFPIAFEMQTKPMGHGYSLFEVKKENPFLPVGGKYRAHEFHYSKPVVEANASLEFAYKVLMGCGIEGCGGGLQYKNVLGSYHHVHALSLPEWVEGMMKAAGRHARTS